MVTDPSLVFSSAVKGSNLAEAPPRSASFSLGGGSAAVTVGTASKRAAISKPADFMGASLAWEQQSMPQTIASVARGRNRHRAWLRRGDFAHADARSSLRDLVARRY